MQMKKHLFLLNFLVMRPLHLRLDSLPVWRWEGGGGGRGLWRILPEKMGVGVRPDFQAPYPIYDQNLPFSLRLVMTFPKIRYLIYDRCS